jgi:ElaB/YqjD/DUF883 family membrane-anchored ribosome-binding protein
MALWGSSGQSDLQSQIDDIQNGLAALGSLLGSGASQAGKTAARGARSAGETVSDTAGDVSAAVGPMLNDLRSQFDNLVGIAGAVTGGLAKRAGKEGKVAYKAVEEKVEDNAMMAVVAAAGVGFLIGAMLLGGSAVARRSAQPQAQAKPQPQKRAAAKSARRGGARRRKAAA